MPEPGGVPYSPQRFHDEVLRAELCELALAYDFNLKRSVNFVNALMRNYHISPKFGRRRND